MTDKTFEEFLKARWTYRRRVMFTTLCFYFSSIAFILYKADPADIGHYNGMLVQLTISFSTVSVAYFGASSYERVNQDVQKDLANFNETMRDKLDK